MKTIITFKEALEKIKQLKSKYYFKRESEHVSIPDLKTGTDEQRGRA